MFGWGYAKDCCISLFKIEQEEKATRLYYAECLRLIGENTAKYGGGRYIEIHLTDILEPKATDNKSAEEIINNIKNKLR